MIPLQHRLACLAIVVISLAATVSAQTAPTGTVTCAEDGFAIEITKAPEAGKVEEIDVKIGTGKTSDGSADDAECVFDTGKSVASSGGAVVSQTDISGKAKLPYGSDSSGGDNKAKCQGTLKDNAGKTLIEYTVAVEVVVRQTIRSVIDRELKYTMNLVCQLTKDVSGQAGVQGWKINRAALTATSTAGNTGTFTFPIEINFSATAGGTAIADNTPYTMGDWVYIRVKETTTNAIFKFVTKKCWFTPSSDSGVKDIFFDNYCPVLKDPAFDDFTAITDKNDPKFDMKVKAFFFTGKPTDKITVSCDLFICLTDDTAATCTQKTRTEALDAGGCAMTSKRRRRNAPGSLRDMSARSVDDKKDYGWIEHRVVTSKQAIILDRNAVIVPTCGGDFVYDRVSKSCSNENLLEISGLYLDIPWNVEYTNTSSQTFKDFASGKAYQLYALMQMTDGGNVIRGLEVVSAKKGSVILTVRIKYSESSNAESAFEVFQRAIERAPARQRASNVLNIRTEKVIEYVEVKRPSPSSGLNVENLTLIIVIVVLCAAVFISVIAVLKVRQARRGASSNAGSEMKAHDNPNFS